MNLSRSQFLRYLGKGASALAIAKSGILSASAKSKSSLRSKPNERFQPISPSEQDSLILPPGYRYNTIALYGDRINPQGDTFGFNSDFNCFFPFEGKKDTGLLWNNHETLGVLEYYVNGYDSQKQGPNKRTDKQIEQYLYALGGSVIRIAKKNGDWTLSPDSSYGRRINGLTEFRLTGPAAGSSAVGNANKVFGTFANCAGGVTFWNTVLSCEENVEWIIEPCKLPHETHYGWVIEVDPFDPKSVPVKHTALGRFAHENAALVLSPSGKIVVYMGDDARDECVYKFVSKNSYDPSLGVENSSLLEAGILYAADFDNGIWIPLDLESNETLKNSKKENGDRHFETQADVLVHCRSAAKICGATPMDRPEDIEIHPLDGTVFIAMTNNDRHGNLFGQILRIREKSGDHAGLEFDFEVFVAGGAGSGFAAPDNLAFDKKGNLWIVTDISGKNLNRSVYKKFGNNGLFVIRTQGPDAGRAFQFASSPIGAELTGLWFAPDQKELFLSVQHPGETTKDYRNPTSRWPHGGNFMPRPGVVAIYLK
ncbi:PhoX family protein [Leptospira alexanderi]|uniref:PF05787 family protein n=1 Tax=Leptospira alexanderi serovar Manhao 3 str. L 60 TaxID=1049759 RepID=V6I3K2_9LEPT|nr:alkaline phosphatase PhoX [Leptospira alexanderi]EQA64182.1 PF05787 family protein [Leptospira alexanderi serovar Manhao 3 str. L 60]